MTPDERDERIDKRRVGLFHKFNVERTDGASSPGQKHDGCDYFVLDLTHDPYALVALKAYASACRDEYPLLAADLDVKLRTESARALLASRHLRGTEYGDV